MYPLSTGLAKACGQNIKGECLFANKVLGNVFIVLLFIGVADTSGTIDLDYMAEKLGIEKSKIDDLSNLLYKNYGTTMAGLRVLFHLLSFHFLAQNGNSLLNSEISDDL